MVIDERNIRFRNIIGMNSGNIEKKKTKEKNESRYRFDNNTISTIYSLYSTARNKIINHRDRKIKIESLLL